MNDRHRRFLALAALSYYAHESHEAFITDQEEDGQEAVTEAEEFIQAHRGEVEDLAGKLPEVVLTAIKGQKEAL